MSCVSCKDNVFVPFKIKLEPGKSKFDLDIPDDVLDKKFSVTDLELVPGFYSSQAAQMNLNEDAEFSAPQALPMTLKIKYRKKYTDIPEYVGDKINVVEFIKDFNDYVEQHKPSYVHRTPAFIDWVMLDLQNKPFADRVNDLVRHNSELLYGVPDPVAFSNAVPESASELVDANDYVLPDDFPRIENIRIRIWMAPYSKFVIRSQEIIDTLGFQGQIDAKNKQFTLKNPNGIWRTLYGKTKPLDKFVKVGWKIDVGPVDIPSSPIAYLMVSKAMLTKPTLLSNEVNENLKKLEMKTNFSTSLYYTQTDGRHQFRFPDSKSVDATVVLPKAVASTLGFLDNEVTRRTKCLPVSKDDDNFDTLKLCRALTIDTGAIVLTQSNLSANNLIGSTNNYVATLKPTAVGTMSLLKLNACTPVLNFDALNPSAVPAHRIVQFQMCTFDDERKLKPLDWPCSSYLQGMLVGKKCLCESNKV